MRMPVVVPMPARNISSTVHSEPSDSPTSALYRRFDIVSVIPAHPGMNEEQSAVSDGYHRTNGILALDDWRDFRRWPAALTASDAWVRDDARVSPVRGRRQPAAFEFHCRNLPPAAVPRTRACMDLILHCAAKQLRSANYFNSAQA
jgi:hypothetical protein